ncbi:ABC transporter permease subunit, partial [Yersinia pestis]
GIHPVYAFAIVLVMGAMFGALMGWIIDSLKLPAFIITLAGMFFIRGMSFIVSEESLPINHPIYETLANYAWRVPGGGRFTLLAFIMLMVVAFGILLAHHTRFGHNVYAIGGNS